MISGIFESIERLIEYIPLDSDFPTNARFRNNTTIDSTYYFEDIDAVAIRLGVIESGNNTISFRDIIKLLNKFLVGASIEEIVATKRYKEIQKISYSDLSMSQLLFNFCLAVLDHDYLNARLYLMHSYHILGLHRELNLLLSVIVNEQNLTEDADVRRLLILLATLAGAANENFELSASNPAFAKRFEIYTKELKRLTPLCANHL